MASKFDTASLKVFDNKIIEQLLENQLITALDMNQFITTDYSLTANPGMTIEIHKYVGSGDVEDLAMTEGNTQDIGAAYTTASYDVVTTQGRVPYFDEQQMNDPTAVDKAIQHLSEQLTNDLTEKVVAELDKATLVNDGAKFEFGDFIDAIATLPAEKNENLFILISKSDYATIQKNLKDDLKYVEDYVRTGYVGSIAGVPIHVSKAIPAGTAFVASKEAVTAFVKKGTEIEQERDANTRKNTIFGRKVMVIALTDDTKVVKLTSKSFTYTAVVSPTGSPLEKGYFEKVGTDYVASTDTSVDSSKTYYTRELK